MTREEQLLARQIQAGGPMLQPAIPKTKELDADELAALIGDEAMMRFAYVPFVIAELAWDYADTIILEAAHLRVENTRKISRSIRQLRVEYERYRAPYIDRQHRNGELDNMFVFEDDVNDLTEKFLIQVKSQVEKDFGTTDSEQTAYYRCIFQCKLILDALKQYVAAQKKIMEQVVKHSIGDILPPHIPTLDRLVGMYLNHHAVSGPMKQYLKTFSGALCNRMMNIGLNETKQ